VPDAEIGVAEVFRRFAGGYLEAHGASMLPSHRRAMADIMACRTEALGGELWGCPECGSMVPVRHSCRNRSCPKCHGEQTEAWLDLRRAEMLPVPYFHVTVTVPEELRAILRSHQRDGYGALISAAGEAIFELAADPRWVGGSVGVLAVLHTWTQQLQLHPHVHCLVTGGGLTEDGTTWHPAGQGFLFPTKALGKLVAGRTLSALKKRCPGLDLPLELWNKPFLVDIKPWGEGEQAVLDYLARYVFRIAITDRRIVAVDDDTVTFEYRDRKSDSTRTCTVSGHEFLRRYLQHVLPAGFHKVRYYGLWHPSKRRRREDLRNALLLRRLAEPMPIADSELPILPAPDPGTDPGKVPLPRECPHCPKGYLVLLRSLSPIKAMGP
jgi:Putative transposase/Transposase zinc-binding domain